MLPPVSLRKFLKRSGKILNPHRAKGVSSIFFAFFSLSLFASSSALLYVVRRLILRKQFDLSFSLRFSLAVCVVHAVCNIILYILTGGRRRMTYRTSFFRLIPKRTLSRWMGVVVTVKFPVFLRVPAFCIYTIFYKCRLQDIQDPLESFSCIADFFTRKLRPDARPIHSIGLVSPVDGAVLTFGDVQSNTMLQTGKTNKPARALRVKGLEYSLCAFLGLTGDEATYELRSVGKRMFLTVTGGLRRVIRGKPRDATAKPEKLDAGELDALVDGLRVNRRTKLCYIVLYLNPGDYHRFHSPAEWTARSRKHFPGTLYPVDKHFVQYKNDLYSVNERLVLEGVWRYGYFSYTAVGAYNVGSMFLNSEPGLSTNQKGRDGKQYTETEYTAETNATFVAELRKGGTEPPRCVASDGVFFDRGTEIGGFRLGSTVVCLFEAPEDFSFVCRPKQKTLFGEMLGWSTADIPDIEGDTWNSALEDLQGVAPAPVKEWLTRKLGEIEAHQAREAGELEE